MAASAYIAAENLHDRRQKRTFFYANKQCDHREIMAPDHAPKWVFDREELWNTVEKRERRKDAQTARTMEFALPRTLDREQRLGLVRRYVKENFVSRGMVADYALHKQGEKNPHWHLQLTMRPLVGDGFGKKERSWNNRSLYREWRENWATSVNQALEGAGSSERIDHRSFKEQGLKKRPTVHEGPAVNALERKGVKTDKRKKNLEIDSYNILAGHTKVKRREREEVSEFDPAGRSLTRGHDRGRPSR